MRAITALGVAVMSVGLAAGSQFLIQEFGATYSPIIVYAWLGLAAGALAGLLYLYFQIGVGPRSTVSQKTAKRMERDLARALAGRSKSNAARAKRIRHRATELSSLIEPAAEAKNVFRRRTRLTNAVLALIFLLSSAFWIFSSMAPQVWPQESWFANHSTPDPYHAALFSVDQVTRGTLFDLFDVFDWNISGYHADPQNQWFSAFIVIYRFLMGGALAAALVVRLGMHEDWREKAAHNAAEEMKERMLKLAATKK
jgi:hypothetical protein